MEVIDVAVAFVPMSSDVTWKESEGSRGERREALIT